MYENYYYPQEILRKSITKTFAWMTLGLLVTAITSYFCYSTGWYLYLIYKIPMMSLIFMLLQIGLVIAFQAAMYRANSTGMKVLFLVHSFTMGISLTSILFVYSSGVITVAFLISALYFACLALVGMTTKKDLTNIGVVCVTGLLVMVLSQAIMMLFRVSIDTRMISIIGLLIFTGITAWDMQRMNKLLVMNDGDVITSEKISIFMALELYLDFINIFLYVLRLLGRNRD